MLSFLTGGAFHHIQMRKNFEFPKHSSALHPVICVYQYPCVCAKSLQSCPTLCDPTDYSLPGSSVYRILQAKILEWVAMPSSRVPSQCRDQTHISCSLALSGGFFTTKTTWEDPRNCTSPLKSYISEDMNNIFCDTSWASYYTYIVLFIEMQGSYW